MQITGLIITHDGGTVKGVGSGGSDGLITFQPRGSGNLVRVDGALFRMLELVGESTTDEDGSIGRRGSQILIAYQKKWFTLSVVSVTLASTISAIVTATYGSVATTLVPGVTTSHLFTYLSGSDLVVKSSAVGVKAEGLASVVGSTISPGSSYSIYNTLSSYETGTISEEGELTTFCIREDYEAVGVTPVISDYIDYTGGFSGGFLEPTEAAVIQNFRDKTVDYIVNTQPTNLTYINQIIGAPKVLHVLGSTRPLMNGEVVFAPSSGYGYITSGAYTLPTGIPGMVAGLPYRIVCETSVVPLTIEKTGPTSSGTGYSGFIAGGLGIHTRLGWIGPLTLVCAEEKTIDTRRTVDTRATTYTNTVTITAQN